MISGKKGLENKMRTLRRILIVHPYGIGDLLFVTPVMRALRLIPTVETVDLLVGSRTREVVENNPHVNDIFVVDKDRYYRQTWQENLKDSLALGRKFRAKRYDLLLDYSLRRESAFFGKFFLGIPKRAGFAYKKRAVFHNIRQPLPDGFWKRHAADFYCDLAEAAGIPEDDRYLEYFFPADRATIEEQVTQKLAGLPGPFITISPGGGDSWGKEAAYKRWPIQNFAELIQKMKHKVGFQGVCILGSQSERELCDGLKKMLNLPSVVLAGETSLAQTAMILKKSKLLIGNDGGLIHLARALQVPLVAFYGPVPPEVYGPYPASPDAVAVYKQSLDCRPCYYKFRYNSTCPTIACLRGLGSDEAMTLLGENGFFEKRKKPAPLETQP